MTKRAMCDKIIEKMEWWRRGQWASHIDLRTKDDVITVMENVVDGFASRRQSGKHMPGTITITIDQQDFGTICVCALRYAMGRMSYMPSLVRDFVRPLFPVFTDKTIGTMIEDCDFQRRNEMYGSDLIDKPGWLQWELEVKAEKERRNRERN